MRGYSIIYTGSSLIGFTAFAEKRMNVRFELMQHDDMITLKELAPQRLKELLQNPTNNFQRFQNA